MALELQVDTEIDRPASSLQIDYIWYEIEAYPWISQARTARAIRSRQSAVEGRVAAQTGTQANEVRFKRDS